MWNPSRKYPLGTTICIEKDAKHFILVAATQFDENNVAKVTTNEYNHMLGELCKWAAIYSQGNEVNFPFVGCGKSYAITEDKFVQNAMPHFKAMKSDIAVILRKESELSLWDLDKQIEE